MDRGWDRRKKSRQTHFSSQKPQTSARGVNISRRCQTVLYLRPARSALQRENGYQPKTFAKMSGATIVASDSMMNRGVSTFSLPQVIFSFGTAPEYEPKLVVESLIWQKYAHSGTGVLTTSWFNMGT